MERPIQSSETPTISSTLKRLREYNESQAEKKIDDTELWHERETQYYRALNMLSGFKPGTEGPLISRISIPHRQSPLLPIPTEDGGSILARLVEQGTTVRDPATENPTGEYEPYMVQIEYWETGVGDDGVAGRVLYEIQPHIVRSFDYSRKTGEEDNTHEWQILGEATMYLDKIETALVEPAI